MSLNLLILFVLLTNTNANVATTAESNYNADLKLMQQQLLDAQSSAQIKNLYTIGVKMLKRMQIQNEQNSLNLDECYERLGKYTRLMVVNNKRRALTNTNNNNDLNNNNNDNSFSGFHINSESPYYVNSNTNQNSNNLLNSKSSDAQASFTLLNEINFYLAELENNYKIIQELRLKIESLNKTKMMPQGVVPPVETIHQFASSNYQANKTDMENDCTMVSGTGFLQIQLTETNLNPNTQQKVGTLYKKQTVLCESQWLIIQQRLNGFETSFNRSWGEYVTGFGSLRSDFWAGLELISQLTQRRAHKLHIELTDWSDQTFYAQYERFEIGNEDDYYRLSLSSDFSGNASRDQIDDAYFGMLAQNGAYFSTYDNNKKIKVNNTYSSSPSYKAYHQQQQQQQKNCALKSGGGWWFNNFSNCLPVNLNGVYVNGASAPSTRGIKWQAIRVQDRNYALKKSRMKIKPVY